MASSSGSKLPEPTGQPPPTHSFAPRDCESCRSAPGIPFCRVEWSFLCTGCASVVHGHSCIIPVAPNPSPNFPQFPYFPYPNPNPRSDPNSVVQLSSSEEEISPGEGQARVWSQIPGKLTSYRRMESVMRYREKRKSRKFEKTVRYENRRAYAELRPRLEGKFACRKDGEGKEKVDVGGELAEKRGKDERSVRYVEDGGDLEGLVGGGVELEQHDFIEDVRFQ